MPAGPSPRAGDLGLASSSLDLSPHVSLMLRSFPRLASYITFSGDLLVLGGACLFTAVLREDARTAWLPVAVGVPYLLVALKVLVSDPYSSLRVVGMLGLVRRSAGLWVRVALGAAVVYLLNPGRVPREPLLLVIGEALPGLLAVRLLGMAARHYVRRRGYNLRFLVIAGVDATARRIARSFEERPGWGYRVQGFLQIGKRPEVPADPTMTVLGHYLDLPRLVREWVIDEIVVATTRSRLDSVEQITALGEEIGLRTHVLTDFVPGSWRAVEARRIEDHVFLTLTPFPDSVFGMFAKRSVDIAGASLGLLVLLPVLLVVAALIKLTTRGPVFYVQERASLNGRLFNFYKFRTMTEGAFEQRDRLAHMNEMTGPVFKIQNDPRVTSIGRFLRRFSIDELPQLWNVIKGDMSLVGPRPLMPHEVAGYETWQRRRMSMRPGLTCLWQINGRNRTTDFTEWVRQDLEYIDNWSLWLDMKILLRTVPAVIAARGAC